MAAEVVVKSRVIAFGGLGRGCFLLLWGDGGGTDDLLRFFVLFSSRSDFFFIIIITSFPSIMILFFSQTPFACGIS